MGNDIFIHTNSLTRHASSNLHLNPNPYSHPNVTVISTQASLNLILDSYKNWRSQIIVKWSSEWVSDWVSVWASDIFVHATCRHIFHTSHVCKNMHAYHTVHGWHTYMPKMNTFHAYILCMDDMYVHTWHKRGKCINNTCACITCIHTCIDSFISIHVQYERETQHKLNGKQFKTLNCRCAVQLVLR